MKAGPNSTIILNETVLNTIYNATSSNISCAYRSIHRKIKTGGNENQFTMSEPKILKFEVPLQEEFLKIECSLGKKNFTQFIPLVPLKPKIEKSVEFQKNDSDALNIILIGIDSISKLNFLRHFNKCHTFLKNNLSAIDMKGYTKVADNTFPNLTPLLTGQFVEHYWNESMNSKMYFDDLDFIWKKYSQKGYATFFAEDSPYTGTYNYLKKGFKNPPTDYYFRPMSLAMDNSDLKKEGGGYCLNSQLEIDIIYGYLEDFVQTMGNRLHFSFTMISTLTHDYLNDAGYADEPTYNLLKNLWINGILNRSMLAIFSDHGIRFGPIRETYIGKFEERMPFMFMVLPKWFLERNETVARNLEKNQNRLTTHFDVHATLYQMLNITHLLTDDEKSIVTPNGISLLEEIPSYRTCEMAKIMPHWCPCQVYQYLPRNDKIAVKASMAIIQEINRQLEPFKDICARLEIDKITDAKLSQANDIVLRFIKHKNDVENRQIVYGDKVSPLSDYLITIKVRPGDGMIEGTVRYNTKDESLQVLGISRINMYGLQSICINSQELRKFCYCNKF